MNETKISWDEVIDRFAEFEEKFNTDPNDPILSNFFEHFASEVLEAGFEPSQLSEVIDKMKNLRSIFANKRIELKNMSSEVQKKKKQLHRYNKNANYKNTVK